MGKHSTPNGNGTAEREAMRALLASGRGIENDADRAVVAAFVRALPRDKAGQLDPGPDARDVAALKAAINFYGTNDRLITGKLPPEPSAEELDAREALAITEVAEAEAGRHFNDLLLEWYDETGRGDFQSRAGRFSARLGPDRGRPAKPNRAKIAQLESDIETQYIVVETCREGTARARGELTAVRLREQRARALAAYTPADPAAYAAQLKRDRDAGKVLDFS